METVIPFLECTVNCMTWFFFGGQSGQDLWQGTCRSTMAAISVTVTYFLDSPFIRVRWKSLSGSVSL